MTQKPENPAWQVAEVAERLRGVSALGLYYSKEAYDRERYRMVQDAALELLSLASTDSLDALEPLRETILSHATPFATADAAVIDASGLMLLIQRSDNGMWAMPGGASQVGETPAQAAVRETLEETGISCEAVALAGVFDSRLCGSLTRHHLYHPPCVPVPAARHRPPFADAPRGDARPRLVRADRLAHSDRPRTREPYPGCIRRVAKRSSCVL